jgi:cysteinyl-tRNA synthetase
MIRFDGDKMSKSIGNIQFINDLLNDHNGETLRLVLMSTHYRQPLNWTAKTIDQSKKTLDRLYRTIKSLNISLDDTNVKPAQEVIDALCDDLNTPEALGQFNLLIKDLENVEGNKKEEKLAKIIPTARMLGILQSNPDSWLGYQKVKTGMDVDKIEQMIEDRNNCRAKKNFQRADEIRDELRSMGIEIEDSAEGTIWKSES